MRKKHYVKMLFLRKNNTFPPQDKRDTRDEAKGLRTTSERYIGELGVRHLSTINSGQDSRQQSHEAVLQGVVEVI